jgi:DNA-directed RNA polymerase specialized sigma24 family protein
MPVESRDSDTAVLETSRIMLGMLVLLAADRDDRVDESPPRRSELVLADAGFTAQEIAKLTGRKYEAVRSSLRRHAQPKTNAKGHAK